MGFKSEEMMKFAINAIEQAVGKDLWGIGSYFNADCLCDTHAGCLCDGSKERSCSIGIMVEAATGIADDNCCIDSIIERDYGLNADEIQEVISRNDEAGGHAAVCEYMRDIGVDSDFKKI